MTFLAAMNSFQHALLRLGPLLTVASVSHGLLSPQSKSAFKFSSLTYSSRRGATRKEVGVPNFSIRARFGEPGDDDEGKAKIPFAPSDFSIVDGDEGDEYNIKPDKESDRYDSYEISGNNNDEDNYGTMPRSENKNGQGWQRTAVPRPPRREARMESPEKRMVGTSWMQKNAKFSNEESNSVANFSRDRGTDRYSNDRLRRSISDPKTFREDFRKTRVFVQGIPQGISWQDLKDHFRVAGNVVFASISVDVNTGETKGHGIVQFETTTMAQNAIDIMRDYPLNGAPLFVREDVQESDNPNAQLRSVAPKGPTPPTKWKCANEENAIYMSDEELGGIRNLIKARDDARRRKKYDVSDRIREELKDTYGVFIDDRLKMWWTSVDGNKVPQSVHDVKGDGRWKLKPWRQIPTTPENDACVDPDLVEGLLKQRDAARKEKDFNTADSLLEKARTSPDGDLSLRIHDESRTWRVWTENRPSFEGEFVDRIDRTTAPSDPDEARKVAASQCLAIVKENAPEKTDEIIEVLKRFPGREFQVLKRLKQQYL